MRRTKRIGHRLANSRVKSIQRFTIVVGSGAGSATATINAVDPRHCTLKHIGQNSDFSVDTLATRNHMAGLVFTNSTTVTAVRSSTGAIALTVSVEVKEYWPGVLASMQRGVQAISGVTTTVTITAVNTTRAELTHLGQTGDSNGFDGYSQAWGTLTNGTTITITNSLGTITWSWYWQVGEEN